MLWGGAVSWWRHLLPPRSQIRLALTLGRADFLRGFGLGSYPASAGTQALTGSDRWRPHAGPNTTPPLKGFRPENMNESKANSNTRHTQVNRYPS